MREITYAEAINEALRQSMELSPDVVVLGQLIDLKPGVFGTTLGLVEKFGAQRVHDFPVSEALMTSVGMGLALAGKRPVLVHHRLDFSLYGMDALTNWISLWRFKSNNTASVPVTIRAVVGKGWGQGPQHSKSLHAWFGHLPGLRVALPATAHDAKGLLMESIFGEDPTIILESRSLFSLKGPVPENPYRVPFGVASICRLGTDVTLVAVGNLVPMAVMAAEILLSKRISVEVVDLRTITPLDKKTILQSVSRTRRLIVVDPGWQSYGAAAEIICLVVEQLGCTLKSNPVRITLPDSHTPTSEPLEKLYYPSEEEVVEAVLKMMKEDHGVP